MACHHYLLAGTLTRIEDELCPHCHNPSLHEGPWYLIRCSGVEQVGVTIGCGDCAIWEILYNDGSTATINENSGGK